ncbi:MAG: hypothetical protein HZA18_06965 [Nitrospirae bacterium]|nr:hypothetical protein [Nitrospirota bacterium]
MRGPTLFSIYQIETEVNAAEKTLQTLTEALANPELYQDKDRFFETMESHARTKKKIEELTAEWERLSGTIEEAGKIKPC